MTIQEYTQRIDDLMWQIESKKEKLLVLESAATCTTSAPSGMPHNPSPSQSRMADVIVKKLELQDSIKADEAEIQSLREYLAATIDQIPSPKYRAVLCKKYIRSMTNEEIAEEIAYSVRTTRRILGEAIRVLSEKMSSS